MRKISSIPVIASRARSHPADANRRSGAMRAAGLVLALSLAAVLAPGSVPFGKALLAQMLSEQAVGRVAASPLRNG